MSRRIKMSTRSTIWARNEPCGILFLQQRLCFSWPFRFISTVFFPQATEMGNFQMVQCFLVSTKFSLKTVRISLINDNIENMASHSTAGERLYNTSIHANAHLHLYIFCLHLSRFTVGLVLLDTNATTTKTSRLVAQHDVARNVKIGGWRSLSN